MGTQTATFGTTRREGHDASAFYNLAINGAAADVDLGDEKAFPDRLKDRVFVEDATKVSEEYRLPDNSVAAFVTSPPYCVGKDYDEDMTMDEYLAMLDAVWRDAYRYLLPGGRACINVANIGRKPYIPLHAFIIQQMCEIGFRMRGEIIWTKGAGAGVSCAWGSWRSASNPVIRDEHEYLIMFSKGDFHRKKDARENSIDKDTFLAATRSVWKMQPASAKRVGHPAPFPVELPRRCIEMYTYVGDVVVDPFMGSGTTGIAAVQTHRYYVGYEKDAEFAKSAQQRIQDSKAVQEEML